MFRVAIVGRPNVGKSTLFNRLCGTRRAIVGDEPGITRDRLEGSVAWNGRAFEVVDTGGMIPDASEEIPAKILEHVEAAIQASDLLLFVVDGRAGITPLDEQLLPILRKSRRPVWVVVNKIDTAAVEPEAAAFYALGFDPVLPVSAEHNLGIGELLDAITARIDEPAAEEEPAKAEEIAVAVVGRPNVGKSSLVNRLVGVERTIVSEIPGTTRDAVDTLVERGGTRFRIVDTAGIRRKGRTEERTEKVSVVMARKHLAQADVAILVIDAEEGVTKLDAAVGGYAFESGCSVLLVLNKWDKIAKSGDTLREYTDSIHRRMKYLAFAPIVAVSALTGQRVEKLFDLIERANRERRIRVATGALNNLFARELESALPSREIAGRLDIRYMTQARTDPPTFVVFTGARKPLHFSAERFLVNKLREKFGFFAAPIRIEQRLRAPKRSGGRRGPKRGGKPRQ